jgi:hypothetical protein
VAALAAPDGVSAVMGTIQMALLMIPNVAIAAFVSALTALGVSYFRTRGQFLATKHDFDELLNQLKTNTDAVETIKSELSQRDWAQREWTNLRRQKLEAPFDKINECETYVDRARSAALRGQNHDDPDVVNQFDIIATLYFPELRREATEFYLASKELTVKLLEFARAVSKARKYRTSGLR